MRLVICDQHVVFAESLAYLLGLRGHEVAVRQRLADARLILECQPIDIAVLDSPLSDEAVVSDLRAVSSTAPHTAIVLLTGQGDRRLYDAAIASGVRAIVHKRRPIDEVIDVLERVHAGESVLDREVVQDPSSPQLTSVNDSHRLAAFLTPREREVLSALVQGAGTSQLAHSLGISTTTARCHIQSVLIKMGAHSRLEVTTAAVHAGLVSAKTGDWLSAAR
jgi:two-component system nitrate/nitrite response regulator NarL